MAGSSLSIFLANIAKGLLGTLSVSAHLKEVGSSLVPARNKKRHAEWTDAARLSVFLHHTGNHWHQLRCRNRFLVHQEILLGHLAGPPHQQPVVRAHPTIHHANVFVNHLHLVHAVLIKKNGLVLVFGSDDDPVRSFDSHRGGTRRHCSQSILDLNEFARRTENKIKYTIKFASWLR